jgi:hypothetical protein
MNYRIPFSIALLLLAILAGCQPYQEGVSEAPRSPSGGAGKWQTVWVDPQILESGKNFTLIRSSRLDSVAVEKNIDYTPGNSPSLTFHIETSNCQTVVELLDSKDKRISLLIAKQLSTGHYKVSFDERGVSPGVYSLRALFCGRSAKKTFAVTS